MNGIAIILNGCDFSAKNLGKVSFLTNIPVTALAIVGSSSVTGTTSQFSVTYTPSNTTQRGISWSILSGETYASVNAISGILTVKVGASNNEVVIKATSVENPTITITKTVMVTYVAPPTTLESIQILGSQTVSGITSTYTVAYTPTNTQSTGVVWSITSGGAYATIDRNSGVLTVNSIANANTVTIMATSTVVGTITATKDITVTYVSGDIELTALAISGQDSITGLTSTYAVSYTPTNTTFRGVVWSITSGSEYATINESTGAVTLKAAANNSSIIIKVASTHNASIFATKTIIGNYLVATSINMRNRVAYAPLPICGSDMTIYLEAETPIDMQSSSVALNLVSGSTTEYLSAIDTFHITQKYAGNDVIQAAIIKTGSKTTSGSEQLATLFSEGKKLTSLLLNTTSTILNGVAATLTDYAIPFIAHNGYVCINTMAPSKTVPVNLLQYTTNQMLQQAVTDGTISPAHTTANFKLKNLIIFKNTKYNTVDEVLANRVNADIDIQIVNGAPKNVGTSGELIYTTA